MFVHILTLTLKERTKKKRKNAKTAPQPLQADSAPPPEGRAEIRAIPPGQQVEKVENEVKAPERERPFLGFNMFQPSKVVFGFRNHPRSTVCRNVY